MGSVQLMYTVMSSIHNQLVPSVLTVTFPADGVPYDGAARERLHMINTVLISLYAIAAIAGILYGIICLLFNIIFRNRK